MMGQAQQVQEVVERPEESWISSDGGASMGTNSMHHITDDEVFGYVLPKYTCMVALVSILQTEVEGICLAE